VYLQFVQSVSVPGRTQPRRDPGLDGLSASPPFRSAFSLSKLTTSPYEQPIRRVYLVRQGEVAYFDHQETRSIPDRPAHRAWTKPDRRSATELLAAGWTGCHPRRFQGRLPRPTSSGRRFGLTPVPDAAWNELEPGNWRSCRRPTFAGVIVDAYRHAPSPGARFFGGELFTSFAERVDEGLARLLADPTWTTLAVVTHDPVARYVLAKALGLGLAGMRFLEQDAGCLDVIDWISGPDGSIEPILRLVNGTPDNLAKAGSREPALARFHQNYLRSRESL
jgi:hypothetical protein